ncbi:MAG: tetratricopeptide repeat protein [Coleofasciculus sp. Co-bin14]|nr:tetratricopeptide repeat protein [Coleofasciculus sp. Co-bin14]
MDRDRPRYELHFHASVQDAVVSDYNKVKPIFQDSLIRPVASPLHQLPPDITHFTGCQEQLDRVTALLQQEKPSGEPASASVVVTGIAGVGKSALAIHVAHQLKSDFPDAQLYVNLRSTEGQPLEPLEVLADLLRAWNVDAQSMPEKLSERSQLYRSLLSQKRALVLLDDVHDEAQVRPLLPDSPTCAVLITSRKNLTGLEEAVAVDLTGMTEAEALALLDKQVGGERIQAEQEAAKKIIDLCDRLPLALCITAGTLRNNPDWQLADYALQLIRERQRLAQLHLTNLEVRATLGLNYQQLEALAKKNQGFLAARLFRFLGLLTGLKFAPAVATALLESEPATAEASFKGLVDRQLLEPASEERYRFHDLVRLFAKEQLAQEELATARQAARLRAARWYLETAQTMNLALNPETRYQLAQVLVADTDKSLKAIEQILFSQALNWFKIERMNLLASVEWVHQAQAWEIVVPLARNLVNFFNTYGYWADWERTHLLAMEGTRHLGDRQGEAQTLTNLGNVYSLQSDWEKASECYEQSQVIFDELSDRLGVAKSLGNLANVYTQQSHWEKARECYQQSLVIFRELGDRYGEAQTLANMGILQIKQGHEQSAAILWQDALSKLPSDLPKSKRVAEWLQSIKLPPSETLVQTRESPPDRQSLYLLGGFILVIAIALFMLLTIW